MKLFEHGRKFFLSVLFLAFVAVLMFASYLLALGTKLTSEWVQLVTMAISVTGGVTGAFAATNAYVSGKAIEAGQEAPPGEGGENT